MRKTWGDKHADAVLHRVPLSSPDLLPRVRTWEAVVHKLCGGADLMLPGVVVKGEFI